MQQNFLTYDVVVEYFSSETIADRYKYLHEKMREYISARKMEEDLVICKDILQQLVMDYFADIYRLKEFHKIENINITKIVAYEVFWILRRKPIQVLDSKQEKRIIFPNEGFATTFIAHELLSPQETEPLSEDEEEDFLKYLRHINYHFKYRCIDKQCLETMLYSFEIGKRIF